MHVAPSSMAGATCPEEGPWANVCVDPVEVTRPTLQTLHPIKGRPRTHRMADVEEPTTKIMGQEGGRWSRAKGKGHPSMKTHNIKIQGKIIRTVHLAIPQHYASLMRAIFSMPVNL